MCRQYCEMKNVLPLLLFFAGDSFFSPFVCLYETNFPYEGEHFIAHSNLKTCVQQRKGHFGLFLNTNTCSGRSKNAYQIGCRRFQSFYKIQVQNHALSRL